MNIWQAMPRRSVLALSLILASIISLNAEGQEGSVSPDQSQGVGIANSCAGNVESALRCSSLYNDHYCKRLVPTLFYYRASPVYDFTYTIVDEHGTHVGMGVIFCRPPLVSPTQRLIRSVKSAFQFG
jgi:hypothetical protein